MAYREMMIVEVSISTRVHLTLIMIQPLTCIAERKPGQNLKENKMK